MKFAEAVELVKEAFIRYFETNMQLKVRDNGRKVKFPKFFAHLDSNVRKRILTEVFASLAIEKVITFHIIRGEVYLVSQIYDDNVYVPQFKR